MARRRCQFALEGLETRQVLSGIWVGGSGNLWSTAANWSDGILPGATTQVTLDSTDTVVLDINATIRSLTIQDSASLDLDGNTLSANTTINAVANGYTQSGGTLDGTDPGSKLRVGGNFTHTGGSFNVENLELVGVTTGTITSGLTFNNVTIAYGSHHLTAAAGYPLNVNGDLTITGYNTFTGDINAYGDVTSTANLSSNASTGTLYLKGTGPQTLSGTGGVGAMPRVVNQKPASQTLTVTGSITPEGWTQVSGKLSAAGSTTTFRRIVSGATVDTGNTELGDVVVQTGGDHFWVKRLDVGGDLTINSALSFQKKAGAPASGVITVAGDLTSNDSTVPGAVDIVMDGGGNVTISGLDFPDGGVTINKGSSSKVAANVTQPLDSLLTLSSMSALTGHFEVGRNVLTKDTGISGNSDGSPVLVFKDNKAQTLTAGVANAAVPGLEFDKSGGSFTLVNNANVSAPNALTVTGGWIVDTTNTAPVNVGGTTVKFLLSGGYGHRTIDTGTSAGFNNAVLASGSGSTLTIHKMIVNGLLSITNVGIISGTIDARGDVTTSDTSVTSGPGTILINGTGNQILSAAPTGGQVPGVTIDKTSGTLSFGSDRIGVTGDWTYVKGTVSATGSTIAFQGYGSRDVDTGSSPSMSFNNVEITKGSGDNLTIVNKLTVGNDLTINSIGTLTADPGTITVVRDLTSNDSSVGGTTNITMLGTVNAKLTGGDFPNGGIIINKGSAQSVDANVTQPLDGPLTLTSMSALTGTLQVGNNVETKDSGISGNGDGSPVLVFKGNKAQTLTATVVNASVPGLEFDKSGGSFTLVNNANVSAPNALTVTGGWIVDATNTAPVNVGGTTVKIGSYSDRTIDTGNSAGFADVVIGIGSGDKLTINKMIVNGNLTLTSASQINGANIDVYGNVTVTGTTTMAGSSRVHFVGTNNQTLAATANNNRMIGVIIEKSGGTLTIDPTYVIDVTGNWDYIGAGTDVVATGSTIRFVGSTKYIRSGAMVFGNVNFAVGSADHVEVLDATVNPGVLYYSGTITNAAKVTVGTLTFVP